MEKMTMAKKIGLIAVIIAEAIICISFLIVIIMLIEKKATVDDLAMIIYAQTGILGIVWGSQSAVNYAKNRQPKQIINNGIGE